MPPAVGYSPVLPPVGYSPVLPRGRPRPAFRYDLLSWVGAACRENEGLVRGSSSSREAARALRPEGVLARPLSMARLGSPACCGPGPAGRRPAWRGPAWRGPAWRGSGGCSAAAGAAGAAPLRWRPRTGSTSVRSPGLSRRLGATDSRSDCGLAGASAAGRRGGVPAGRALAGLDGAGFGWAGPDAAEASLAWVGCAVRAVVASGLSADNSAQYCSSDSLSHSVLGQSSSSPRLLLRDCRDRLLAGACGLLAARDVLLAGRGVSVRIRGNTSESVSAGSSLRSGVNSGPPDGGALSVIAGKGRCRKAAHAVRSHN